MHLYLFLFYFLVSLFVLVSFIIAHVGQLILCYFGSTQNAICTLGVILLPLLCN